MYTEKPGKYVALLWDGTNQQEVTDLVASGGYSTANPQVLEINGESGWLVFGYDPLIGNGPSVPPASWVVLGPFWNGGPQQSGTVMATFSDEVFQTRFQQAP